jgi:hypothetical protein
MNRNTKKAAIDNLGLTCITIVVVAGAFFLATFLTSFLLALLAIVR